MQKVVVLIRQGRHKYWEGKWGFQRKENDEWELGKSEEAYKNFDDAVSVTVTDNMQIWSSPGRLEFWVKLAPTTKQAITAPAYPITKTIWETERVK